MQIYHNPRCRKSREALQLIESKGIEPDIILYMKEEPSKEDLKSVLKKLGINAESLIRKNEKIFKEEFKGQELTEDDWIEAMIKYPNLIERPIIISGNKAVVARPAEKALELL